MRIVFKVVAIIGVLSFFGGLKNGVFFFFGLLLAGIFGYFGWRPQKKLEEQKESPRKNLDNKFDNANNQFSPKPLSDSVKLNSSDKLSVLELERKIEVLNQKKNLLISSYNEGLLNRQEYISKKLTLDLTISELSDALTVSLTTKKAILDNKNLFDRLLELKTQELISNEEFNMKYNILLTSLINKSDFQKQEPEKNDSPEDDLPNSLAIQGTTNISGTGKKRSLIWLSTFAIILAALICYIKFSSDSRDSKYDNSRTQSKTTYSLDEKIVNKIILPKDSAKISSHENREIIKSSHEENTNPLDRIYLGTHLFGGMNGKWGKVKISKKENFYWITGEYKVNKVDWVRIEGKILNPTIQGFTFDGEISAYSPSNAKSINEYDFLKKDKNKFYGDSCIWKGQTDAYKLFEDRKYWRIKTHDCYHYTQDLDIFHN